MDADGRQAGQMVAHFEIASLHAVLQRDVEVNGGVAHVRKSSRPPPTVCCTETQAQIGEQLAKGSPCYKETQ